MAAGAREQPALDLVEQGAADHELAPDPLSERLDGVVVLPDVGEPGLRQRAGEARAVGGLADHRDRDETRPGRLQGLLDRPRECVVEAAQGQHPDPLSPQLTADQRRIDPLGELVGAAQLPRQLIGTAARRLEVAGEARLEVLLGAREDVVAEADPDQDPNREGEKDGSQRGRVIARAIPI